MNVLRPIGDRYIIDPILPEDKINGIIIPDIAKKPPKEGKVIAMSELMKKQDIAVGDIVLFSSYAASHITFDNKEMFLVRHHDILAIL